MITRPVNDYLSEDDNALVREARKGDTGAFEKLVARHRDKVFTRAFSILRNVEDAIDLSQRAWVEGWQGLRRFHGDLSFGAWITRIVIHLCVDQLLKEKSRRAECFEEPDEESSRGNRQMRSVMANPTGWLEPAELKQRMDQALGQLADAHRIVLVLHEFENMKYKEIAATMGCSIEVVTSQLLYARRKIAALLAGQQDRRLGIF
jgi:RNA polymerase sigma-70 factor (ECF subfamily)